MDSYPGIIDAISLQCEWLTKTLFGHLLDIWIYDHQSPNYILTEKKHIVSHLPINDLLH